MFDPFEKRMSRDIRNRLAEDFLSTLKKNDLAAFEKKASALRETAPDYDHMAFIDQRTERCRTLFGLTPSQSPFDTAHKLWKHGLYYECHEWLEPLWIKARGSSKKAVQGIIRAAGAHVLYEAGRTKPARSSAVKALAIITQCKSNIPPPFDAGELIRDLDRLTEEKIP